MMRLIRIPAILAFMIVTLSAPAAFDYGLELSNSGGIKKVEDPEFFTDHKETIWITAPFNNKNTASLAVEGSFYAEKPAGEDDFDYYLDIDLFRYKNILSNNTQGKITLNAGRLPVSDSTGKILNQPLDGFELQGIKAFGNFSFFAGYTGLLNARQETILMTADDRADCVTDDIYALGAKRVVAKASIQIPELIAGADLIIEALGQYDLRDSLESDAAETIHTGYGTLIVSGPASPTVFYTLGATFQTGVLDSDDTYSEHAIMGLGRIDVFPSKQLSFSTEVIYTTGEDDFFSFFLPITYQNAGTLFSYGYSNVMKGSAGLQYNPMDMLNVNAGIAVFMYPKEIDTEDGLYRATEASAGITYKLYSDLKLRFDGTLLFPKDEDMLYKTELRVIFNL